jgi:glyoxylase-like metal-dependent hydrolase (beta-lactamase superfamily II)
VFACPSPAQRWHNRRLATLPGVIEEILPGVLHWTAFRDTIGRDVHSYYVPESLALIDPMQPDEGLDWFGQHGPPERILLTNRHHYRNSGTFVDRFGCRVLCQRDGLREFEGGAAVNGFSFGDEVAPGISAERVAVLCPEETAFYIGSAGALSFADAIVRGDDGALRFVSDPLLGDDPEAIKDGLRESFRALLELDFDSILLAHGQPLVGGGKEALREFAGT